MKRYGMVIGLQPDKVEEWNSHVLVPEAMRPWLACRRLACPPEVGRGSRPRWETGGLLSQETRHERL